MNSQPVCKLVDVTRDGIAHRTDLHFVCPGCDGELHAPTVKLLVPNPFDVDHHPCWEWNCDLVHPTLSPSIKVTGYRMNDEGKAMLARGESPPDGQYPGAETVCHSFVRDGQIQFLDDCTHALAGQTVPLEVWE